MSTATVHVGNALDVLRTLPDGSVRCCVTSPPYWGLRDYGEAGQLGLEPTPDAYVANLVAVCREVRRVLADDGTLWLNLGDSYARSPEKGGSGTPNGRNGYGEGYGVAQSAKIGSSDGAVGRADRPGTRAGGKPKDLVGIPWRVAFALQADGWYLRSDIIWSKPNPMPESVTDRPTKAHEYLFLLSKSARYFYDAAAIAEPSNGAWNSSKSFSAGGLRARLGHGAGGRQWDGTESHADEWQVGRNARTVWTIATQPYPEAHFATFPEELPRRCILAGSAPGDTVLDPFAGSGTTLAVAIGNGRHGVGVELNPAYAEMASRRIGPMFCTVVADLPHDSRIPGVA